jgi:hypothetical protein
LVLIVLFAGTRTKAQTASQGGAPASGATSNSSAEPPPLDYEYFKMRVEPIFLKKTAQSRPLLRLSRGSQSRLQADETVAW